MAEIAVRQADAANVIVRNADSIRAQPGLDPKSAKSLLEAARYQTFLEVLNEVSANNYQFTTTEIHVTES